MLSLLLAAACSLTLSAAVVPVDPFSEPLSLVQQQVRSVRRSSSNETELTPLTIFRDAVVKRPTPPIHLWPIPQIQWLEHADLPAGAASHCGTILFMLDQTPALQEPIFIQGGHIAAIKAMGRFSSDATVQVSCTNLLSQMAQWNWVLSRAMARDGAIDAIVNAMKHFPDHAGVRSLTGPLGAFTDFDDQNRKMLMDEGLVELVYNATDKHYTQEEVAQMYNLWSTLCGVPEVAEQMVQNYSELERGVKAMKTHRRGTVRGEVIQVHSQCFGNKASWRMRSVDAGILPELLSAMRDEIAGTHGEIDTVGKERMLFNAMNWMKLIASDSQEQRAAVLAAGAWGGVMGVLQDVAANGDHRSEHNFEEMQHNLCSEACNLLTELVGYSPAEREHFVQATSLPQLRTVLNTTVFQSHLPGSCSQLMNHWPQ